MKLTKLIYYYLKDTATITVVNEFKEILYDGTVKDIPINFSIHKEVISVSGFGSHNDLIIEIEECN